MKAILFFVFLVFTTPVFAQSVQDGIDKYQAHHFEEAYKILKPFSDQGDLKAMKYIGFMYWNGLGVSLDYSKGCDYFEKASAHDDMEAITYFGLCYVQDKGRSEDKNKAFSLLKKSYDGGYKNSQSMLGKLAIDVGEWQLALRLLEPLAAAGNSVYMTIVGAMYRDGMGVAIDHKVACEWFRKSAELKRPSGLHNYGDCFYFGLGRPADKEKAYMLFKEAADLGSEKSKSAAKAVYEELYGKGK